MRILLFILLVISNPVFGADKDGLVGTWKLVSCQVIAENGPPQDAFGAHPKGFLILTREGRSMVLTTAEKRHAGMGESERAALHKSMLAYTGVYSVEGDDFITKVEVSWNEEWNGSEQRRHFRIEGNKLFIESAPAPSILFPGKTDSRIDIEPSDTLTHTSVELLAGPLDFRRGAYLHSWSVPVL